MFNLENKVALVTGATSGIGQRQAIALSQAGAKIIAVGRNSQRLDDTLAELASPGVAVQCDLASANLSEVFTDAIAQAGGVDILCNTAGVNLREPADKITAESWHQTLYLNLTLPFFLSRELVPLMRARGGGKIINIASLQSLSLIHI